MSALLDIKGSRNGKEFAPEDRAHLVSYLTSLLEFSPRGFAIGGLCDGHIIQFFKVTPQGSINATQRTPAHNLNGDGGKHLMWLLHASPEQLGMCVYDVRVAGREVEVTSFLGRGGHSVVYSAMHDGLTVHFFLCGLYLDA